MELTSLGPGFGAEVKGANLIDVVSSDIAYRQVRAAFEEHSVLLFRDQQVTDDLQAAFSRAFGPLVIVNTRSVGVGSFYSRLNNLAPDGSVVPDTHRQTLIARANQLWHTDFSFKTTPALASVLSSRNLPKLSGETEFVSTRLAWEKLPPKRQAQLRDLVVRHSYWASRDQIDPRLVTPAERDELPPARWRMTWRNPVNDRCGLYLASHAFAVEGMGDHEGRALIAELIAAATRPEATYRHVWRAGDVLMWDNRATMHRGRPWPAGEPRVAVRTTVQAIEADGLSEVRPTA
jgi:alpha-ketoglutarate-dependent 2,4-dichlorophenoxyacetate dioxygenase